MSIVKGKLKNMKKINDFMTNAPLWKIFVASFFSMSLFCLLFFWYFLEMPIFTLSLSGIMTILFSTLMTISMHSCRLSDKFWSAAKEFEAKLESAETKEELTLLYEEELPKLKNLSMGGAHVSEVNKLIAVINTKIKYVK